MKQITPEEKGKELIRKFKEEIPDYLYKGKMLDMAAKQCAAICVQEILDAFEKDDLYHGDCHNINSSVYKYYEQVLKSLNNK